MSKKQNESRAFVLTRETKEEIEKAAKKARTYLVENELTPRFVVAYERVKEMDGRRAYALYVYDEDNTRD